ncbi:MAG: 5-oxoprolinase subunit PxpB [Chloroflexi bacterium]|nr:5-oxoprolinase subunit PxpB [Chloroflexota bacterium]
MIHSLPRLRAAGDSAILIEWADEINDDVNDRVHTFVRFLAAQNHSAIHDLIPAYSSLLVCYDPARALFDVMRAWLADALMTAPIQRDVESRVVEIPTRYGGEYGPDLEFVAHFARVTQEQVVRLHASVLYRVYLVGFAPGFAYLGSVPEQIAAPRLATPRTRVPAGSVGIAGKQTGIYPSTTPGGWQLIGRTDLAMFDPRRDSPTLLRPGDRVRFVAVS